jgi:hypothetical protein
MGEAERDCTLWHASLQLAQIIAVLCVRALRMGQDRWVR